MKIFIINMPSSIERKEFQIQQAKKLNLDVEFFSAVTPNDFSENTYKVLSQSWERIMSSGEVGCFLSHKALWEKIAKLNEPCVILEDDALMIKNMASLLAELATQEGVDRINLEGRNKRKLMSVNGDQVGAFMLKDLYVDRAGSAGYVIWPSGAKKLLGYYVNRAAIADKALRLFNMRSLQLSPIAVLTNEYCETFGFEAPMVTESTINAVKKATPLRCRLRRLIGQGLLVLEQAKAYLRGAENKVPTVDINYFK